MTVWIWYPAEPAPGATLQHLSDLLTREFGETDRDWLYEEPVKFGADSTALAALPGRPTQAYWEATPVEISAPLVVSVQGFGHPAFINEETNTFLASHGYIVAATSFGWPEESSDPLENQVRDIELAIQVVGRKVPQFEGEQVALMGHSAGGLAAPVAAIRNERVDALVLLEASLLGKNEAARIREEPRWGGGIQIPALLAQSRWWRLAEKPSPNLDPLILNDFHGLLVTMDMKTMEHGDFVSLDHLRSETLDYAKFGIEYDFGRAGRGLGIIQSATLDFLDSILKGDSSALEALQRGPNDVADDVVYLFQPNGAK